MLSLQRGIWVFLLGVFTTAFFPSTGQATAAVAPDSIAQQAPISFDRQGEVQIEGGLAIPLSDLSAGFLQTQHGMGAGRGYHLGLRVRFYPARRLVVAPNFSYIEFGAHEGLADNDDMFTVHALILRYGIDLTYLLCGRSRSFRPFLGVGAAVARNKYREEFLDADTLYLAGVNSLTGSLIAGVRWNDLDISLMYEMNRFTTSLFSYSGEAFKYRWNSILLRLSYTLPRI